MASGKNLSGKNFAGWVPGPFVEGAERIVRDEYDGNSSKFVADLVEQRVKHGAPKLRQNPNVLVDLAAVLAPVIESKLRDSLAGRGIDQPIALANLLAAALEASSRGVDLTKPFAIYNSEEQMAAFMAKRPGGPEFLARIRDLANSLSDSAADPIPPSPVGKVIRDHHKRDREEQDAKPAGSATRPQSRAKH